MFFKKYMKVVPLFIFVVIVLAGAAILFNIYIGTGTGKSNKNESKIDLNVEGNKSKDATSETIIGNSLKYDLARPVNENKPITLKFWINEDWSDIYTSLINEYTSIHPNVIFDVSQFPWNVYWNKINVALESGEGPDLFHMHNEFVIPMLQYLEPLPYDEFPMEQLKADFMQVETSMIGEKMYYVNVGIMTGGIFYNKKMWAESGLTMQDIPQIWEELRTVARKLTVYDSGGHILRAGFSFNGVEEYILEAMNLQRGQFLFSEDGRFSRFNNPASIENARFLRDLYYKDLVGDAKMEPAKDAFGFGKTAMIYAWGWTANDLDRNYPSIEYGFFRIPTWWPGEPPAFDRNNAECSFSVNKHSDENKKKIAFDFLKYYLSSDNALINAAKKAYMVPSKISLLGRPELSENVVITEQAKYIDRTCFPGILPNEFTNCLKTSIGQNLMEPSITPEEVLRRTDIAINKILPAYRFETMERKYKYAGEFKK
ncbi:MAG: extracellular solute-binding protein [Ruminiclostridium sp.]|nr:extracellular solute-binding protein [Ruminiclostridium sp.]